MGGGHWVCGLLLKSVTMEENGQNLSHITWRRLRITPYCSEQYIKTSLLTTKSVECRSFLAFGCVITHSALTGKGSKKKRKLVEFHYSNMLIGKLFWYFLWSNLPKWVSGGATSSSSSSAGLEEGGKRKKYNKLQNKMKWTVNIVCSGWNSRGVFSGKGLDSIPRHDWVLK